MEMQQNELLETLKANQSLETEEQAWNFLTAVRQLKPDNSLLPSILYFFFDDMEYHNPLKYLANYVAMLDKNLFAISLVETTPALITRAKDWLILFFMGPLRNQQQRNVLIEAIRKASDTDRAIILELFNEMLTELRNNDFDLEIRDGILFVKDNL
jgi:hypothetical protein